jgi:hypothetical protein
LLEVFFEDFEPNFVIPRNGQKIPVVLLNAVTDALKK